MQKMVSHVKIAPQTTEIKIDDHLMSTPFGSIIGKKQYSFSSKNGPKGVLLFPDFQSKRSASLKKKKIQKFQTSTPFAPKIEQKEYSFCSKNWPKGVLLLVKNPLEGVLLLVKKEPSYHMWLVVRAHFRRLNGPQCIHFLQSDIKYGLYNLPAEILF